MVSSMAGVLPGNPSVAVYAATKAFEKSLASGLGREMERYGVGVTCLLPGAVKDTSFASQSKVLQQAACYHFPGYAKTPELVAGAGVKGLMLGYPEIYPGWQNRAFVKMFLPMLPPRVSNMVGEWAWNPWQWGDVMPNHRSSGSGSRDEEANVERKEKTLPPLSPQSVAAPPPSSTWTFRRSTSEPSNQMKLPDVASDVSTGHQPTAAMEVMIDPSGKEGFEYIVDTNTTISEIEADSGENMGILRCDIPNDNDVVIPPLVSSSSVQAVAVPLEQTDKNDSSAAAGPTAENDQNNKGGKTPKPPSAAGKERSLQEKNENVVVPQEEVVPATSNSLVLPPASSLPNGPSTPTQLSLFGFFDKENKKQPSTASSGEKVAKETDAITGGAVESTSPPDETATWYPSMMDTKDYDFRDRRLDY